jgi:hypothetical protein
MMILSPLTKKVEVYVGYRGFYTCGREKVTITVEEAGIGALIDTRSGRPNEKGLLMRYFKPMVSLEEAKRYIEKEFLELPSFQLEEIGFIELKRTEI